MTYGGDTSLSWILAGEQVPALQGRREGVKMKDDKSISQIISDLESNFSEDSRGGREGRILSPKLQREERL